MQETISFQEVKSAYVEMYGEFYDEQEFNNFDDAFQVAWDSFNYITNATDEYEFAQGMTELPQLTQFD